MALTTIHELKTVKPTALPGLRTMFRSHHAWFQVRWSFRVKKKWRREECRDYYIEYDYTRKFNKLHPGRLTWNLRIHPTEKEKSSSKTSIFSDVNLRGLYLHGWSTKKTNPQPTYYISPPRNEAINYRRP